MKTGSLEGFCLILGTRVFTKIFRGWASVCPAWWVSFIEAVTSLEPCGKGIISLLSHLVFSSPNFCWFSLCFPLFSFSRDCAKNIVLLKKPPSSYLGLIFSLGSNARAQSSLEAEINRSPCRLPSVCSAEGLVEYLTCFHQSNFSFSFSNLCSCVSYLPQSMHVPGLWWRRALFNLFIPFGKTGSFLIQGPNWKWIPHPGGPWFITGNTSRQCPGAALGACYGTLAPSVVLVYGGGPVNICWMNSWCSSISCPVLCRSPVISSQNLPSMQQSKDISQTIFQYSVEI